MGYRLLKFDIIHPENYLERKHQEWDDIDQLTSQEYRERLNSLRSNYSDFYTFYLNEMGWEAEEFYLLDSFYLSKLGKELFGLLSPWYKLKSKILQKIRPARFGWDKTVIDAYIKRFKPDVIFVRSQPIPSAFWQKYRDQVLLVSRLSARLPKRWHPDDWDIVYTDLKVFKDFFDGHDTKAILNKQGFDPRINDELINRKKQHDLVFVGGMGTQNFLQRTHFFEQIAAQTDFKWWGYWWKYGGNGSLEDFPNLKKSFQGPTSGLEMYQIYRDSKIVLNDYVDTASGVGFNQRIFEVMGVGGFLLTREAKNFKETFPNDVFDTFTDVENCLSKIEYFLKNPEKRDVFEKKAKNFIHKHYHYREIVEKFSRDLESIMKS